MCPECRVRVVPRRALRRIARDPDLAARSPLGIPSDDISNDSPHSRVLRMALSVFLIVCAGLLFTSAFASVERCDRLKGDRTVSVQYARSVCERLVWHNVLGGVCLLSAVGIMVTLAAGRHEHRGHVPNLP